MEAKQFTLTEAAKLAVEALEEWEKPMSKGSLEAHRILRTAIAEAEKQEPVAWAVIGDGEHGEYEVGRMLEKKSKPNSEYWEARGYSLVPLYTTPPAAQRQPLTDEQMKLLWAEYGYRSAMCKPFARAIEAAHGIKEKNT